MNSETTSCLSLRMGLNITERYHVGSSWLMCGNAWGIGEDFMFWSKTAHAYGSYWSYDLSVDGHVFTRNRLFEMIDELCLLQDKKMG